MQVIKIGIRFSNYLTTTTGENMPQGKGTYGSQVGRPSEDKETILGGKRTSYVNDNKWWSRLSHGLKNINRRSNGGY